MTHDWQQTRQLLIAGSVPAIEAFFAVHPLSELRAIGYTWEWGQSAAAFYLVANTAAGLAQGLIDARRYNPEADVELIRWDAGYFPYPAGLTGPDDEMGVAWEAEADRLYAMTQNMMAIDTNDAAQYALYSQNYEQFLRDLVQTCCEALAKMAVNGLFGDFASVDFWVGSTDENGDIVKSRNARIRQMIAARSTDLKG
jgi:hypothetical protein